MLASQLENSCEDLEKANKKLLGITEENLALGPHKEAVKKCLEETGETTKHAKDDTEKLAEIIKQTSAGIRLIIEQHKYAKK